MTTAILSRPSDAISIRRATPADVPAMAALIEASARALGSGYYDDRALTAAIDGVFGVDSMLVADGTYFVAEIDGAMAGCGGWSRRGTLFGSDRFIGRADDLLDPATSPARIRAMFVAPAFARRGVGSAILRAGQDAARAAGFTAVELMATLSGVDFYRERGFVAAPETFVAVGDATVVFIPMHKHLSA
ncbi:GNAT family N-acetyltransferase [Sphingomonas sp. S1-29]|uniref:GNAT family N-acetyltransferase n=1 Tax=Sphingomonas sp. S1-29 TaxID=2991074 RepID=UPI002240D6C5|nr:GNAT family N-acetyltransferase [Sphingomonas sp. S1-29]UZK70101.1 GNAT family N-acetyltransferase [Sphingomonas sp. S1-29]